uniref:Uncharacterized protein n=2 Tax=viral metagenome TaxID=1070528 RepID=A0A6M3IRP0_9ZZZZ
MIGRRMKPKDFQASLTACIVDARRQGLSDTAILLEFLEQTRLLIVKQALHVAGQESRKPNS